MINDPIAEMEAHYLGCLLKDNSLIDEVALAAHNFTVSYHREWFKTILEFHKDGKVLDLATVITIESGKLENLGGRQYMLSMIEAVPSIHAFKSYQSSILNAYHIQQAKDIALNFLQNTSTFGKPEDLKAFMDQVMRLETSSITPTQNFNSRLQRRMLEHMESPVNGLVGVDTGFKVLNKLTDGWCKQDLIVIGARPSMGKTAFGLASLAKGMLNDTDVYPTFFSAEMGDGGIIDRLIAQIGGINLAFFRNVNKYMTKDDDLRRYNMATGILSKSTFALEEDNTVPEIRARMRKRIKEHPDKKHVCCIDFLTQLRVVNPTGNANYDYGNIVSELKQMAKDLNIPVILLVQLNRKVEDRADKRPQMSDIRETGTVEQAADFVGFLYRDDYYNRDKEPTNITELIIAKNRQGITGTVYFKVDLKTQNFLDLDRNDH